MTAKPHRGPVIALAAIAAVTVVWWSLALWPIDAGAPAWLARAQAICFGTRPGGLPDAAGWTALVLQPAIMFGMLGALWGRSLADALRAAVRLPAGRVLLAGAALGTAFAAGLAGWRVAVAAELVGPAARAAGQTDTVSRLDWSAPALDLVDQHGESVSLQRFRGRAVLVTFAFGRCETVCPAIVHDLRSVRRRVGDAAPPLVVVTLDPWRDLPSRLPAIARRWRLSAGEYVASGSVERVNAVLDAWRVGRERDPATGDIVHGRLVYVVDSVGRVAWATGGRPETLTPLLSGI